MRTAVVTGGAGFIGAALARRLVQDGWSVRVLDNMARGLRQRLSDVDADIEWHVADVRERSAVVEASRGADVIFHLAAVNGTDNFYNHPDLVLDVGLRGALAAVDGARDAGVPDIVVASSAEVYQTPPSVPTDENVPLTLPDSLNPRYSYGGSKLVSELIAFNYHRDYFRKVQVFRPHNVYGPDMGWKHVVPDFILRAFSAIEASGGGEVPFPIQGDGSETRAFTYVDDVVDSILLMYERGGHREVFHIGSDDMIGIGDLARLIGSLMGRELTLVAGPAAVGGTPVRCPDVSKMRALGYEQRVPLEEGLRRTIAWYSDNRSPPSDNQLL